MEDKKNNIYSFLISFIIHAFILALFAFVTISIEADESDFVTLGFGTFGKVSSSGTASKKKEEIKKPKKVDEKKTVEKKVELPKVQNQDEENNVVAKKVEEKKEEPEPEKVKPLDADEEEDTKRKDNIGEGEGNYGFEIDFGGKGIRKIYSYSLPSYPEGVSKEIDVKLRFSILPDGSVGRIFPLIKADTKLEMAAINSLRQWRFEPLPSIQKQIEQKAVITFPYRLQ